MEMRQRPGMRRLVGVTLEQLQDGVLEPSHGARALHGAGVPFSVIGRVLDPDHLARLRTEPAHPADAPSDALPAA